MVRRVQTGALMLFPVLGDRLQIRARRLALAFDPHGKFKLFLLENAQGLLTFLG
jgi:hypothetical protein